MSRLSARLACLTIAIAAMTAAASGQDTPAPSGPTACPAPLVVVGRSYSADTLLLVLDPGYGIKPVYSTMAQTALYTVGGELELPAPLPMPPVIAKWFTGGPDGGDAMSMSGAQGFMGEAFIEIAHDGKIKRTGLTQSTLVPAIDAALVAAVQKAADEGAFMAYQEASHDHGGFVFVQLRTMPLPNFTEKAQDFKRPESLVNLPVPYQDEPKLKKKGGTVTLPIRVLHVPLVAVTSRLEITKRGPSPNFPLDELEGRQDGFVNVEFVVGPDGTLVPGTLRIANAMTTGYARAVINSLKEFRFKPAMAGACPVASRLTYTFTFDVR
jgi:hypothetical protein